MKRLLPRALLSLLLAALTTLAVSWALALYAPISAGRGTVSQDGDHLQPWILHLTRPGAERFIHFEKGRVYNKQGVGSPWSSSAAVACWSFATSTRTNPNFSRGQVPRPAALDAEMSRQPRTAWGVARDSRGWPFPAFACDFVGTTATGTSSTYGVRNGIYMEPSTEVSDPLFSGYTRAGQSVESLFDIRALPLRPLWPGLLANTALAFLAWLALLTATSHLITTIKSRLRKPAGHCPKCNYDLKGNFPSGCPECGWNKHTKQSPATDDTDAHR